MSTVILFNALDKFRGNNYSPSVHNKALLRSHNIVVSGANNGTGIQAILSGQVQYLTVFIFHYLDELSMNIAVEFQQTNLFINVYLKTTLA